MSCPGSLSLERSVDFEEDSDFKRDREAWPSSCSAMLDTNGRSKWSTLDAGSVPAENRLKDLPDKDLLLIQISQPFYF